MDDSLLRATQEKLRDLKDRVNAFKQAQKKPRRTSHSVMLQASPTVVHQNGDTSSSPVDEEADKQLNIALLQQIERKRARQRKEMQQLMGDRLCAHPSRMKSPSRALSSIIDNSELPQKISGQQLKSPCRNCDKVTGLTIEEEEEQSENEANEEYLTLYPIKDDSPSGIVTSLKDSLFECKRKKEIEQTHTGYITFKKKLKSSGIRFTFCQANDREEGVCFGSGENESIESTKRQEMQGNKEQEINNFFQRSWKSLLDINLHIDVMALSLELGVDITKIVNEAIELEWRRIVESECRGQINGSGSLPQEGIDLLLQKKRQEVSSRLLTNLYCHLKKLYHSRSKQKDKSMVASGINKEQTFVFQDPFPLPKELKQRDFSLNEEGKTNLCNVTESNDAFRKNMRITLEKGGGGQIFLAEEKERKLVHYLRASIDKYIQFQLREPKEESSLSSNEQGEREEARDTIGNQDNISEQRLDEIGMLSLQTKNEIDFVLIQNQTKKKQGGYGEHTFQLLECYYLLGEKIKKLTIGLAYLFENIITNNDLQILWQHQFNSLSSILMKQQDKRFRVTSAVPPIEEPNRKEEGEDDIRRGANLDKKPDYEDKYENKKNEIDFTVPTQYITWGAINSKEKVSEEKIVSKALHPSPFLHSILKLYNQLLGSRKDEELVLPSIEEVDSAETYVLSCIDLYKEKEKMLAQAIDIVNEYDSISQKIPLGLSNPQPQDALDIEENCFNTLISNENMKMETFRNEQIRNVQSEGLLGGELMKTKEWHEKYWDEFIEWRMGCVEEKAKEIKENNKQVRKALEFLGSTTQESDLRDISHFLKGASKENESLHTSIATQDDEEKEEDNPHDGLMVPLQSNSLSSDNKIETTKMQKSNNEKIPLWKAVKKLTVFLSRGIVRNQLLHDNKITNSLSHSLAFFMAGRTYQILFNKWEESLLERKNQEGDLGAISIPIMELLLIKYHEMRLRSALAFSDNVEQQLRKTLSDLVTDKIVSQIDDCVERLTILKHSLESFDVASTVLNNNSSLNPIVSVSEEEVLETLAAAKDLLAGTHEKKGELWRKWKEESNLAVIQAIQNAENNTILRNYIREKLVKYRIRSRIVQSEAQRKFLNNSLIKTLELKVIASGKLERERISLSYADQIHKSVHANQSMYDFLIRAAFEVYLLWNQSSHQELIYLTGKEEERLEKVEENMEFYLPQKFETIKKKYFTALPFLTGTSGTILNSMSVGGVTEGSMMRQSNLDNKKLSTLSAVRSSVGAMIRERYSIAYDKLIMESHPLYEDVGERLGYAMELWAKNDLQDKLLTNLNRSFEKYRMYMQQRESELISLTEDPGLSCLLPIKSSLLQKIVQKHSEKDFSASYPGFSHLLTQSPGAPISANDSSLENMKWVELCEMVMSESVFDNFSLFYLLMKFYVLAMGRTSQGVELLGLVNNENIINTTKIVDLVRKECYDQVDRRFAELHGDDFYESEFSQIKSPRYRIKKLERLRKTTKSQQNLIHIYNQAFDILKKGKGEWFDYLYQALHFFPEWVRAKNLEEELHLLEIERQKRKEDHVWRSKQKLKSLTFSLHTLRESFAKWEREWQTNFQLRLRRKKKLEETIQNINRFFVHELSKFLPKYLLMMNNEIDKVEHFNNGSSWKSQDLERLTAHLSLLIQSNHEIDNNALRRELEYFLGRISLNSLQLLFNNTPVRFRSYTIDAFAHSKQLYPTLERWAEQYETSVVPSSIIQSLIFSATQLEENVAKDAEIHEIHEKNIVRLRSILHFLDICISSEVNDYALVVSFLNSHFTEEAMCEGEVQSDTSVWTSALKSIIQGFFTLYNSLIITLLIHPVEDSVENSLKVAVEREVPRLAIKSAEIEYERRMEAKLNNLDDEIMAECKNNRSFLRQKEELLQQLALQKEEKKAAKQKSQDYDSDNVSPNLETQVESQIMNTKVEEKKKKMSLPKNKKSEPLPKNESRKKPTQKKKKQILLKHSLKKIEQTLLSSSLNVSNPAKKRKQQRKRVAPLIKKKNKEKKKIKNVLALRLSRINKDIEEVLRNCEINAIEKRKNGRLSEIISLGIRKTQFVHNRLREDLFKLQNKLLAKMKLFVPKGIAQLLQPVGMTEGEYYHMLLNKSEVLSMQTTLLNEISTIRRNLEDLSSSFLTLRIDDKESINIHNLEQYLHSIISSADKYLEVSSGISLFSDTVLRRILYGLEPSTSTKSTFLRRVRSSLEVNHQGISSDLPLKGRQLDLPDGTSRKTVRSFESSAFHKIYSRLSEELEEVGHWKEAVDATITANKSAIMNLQEQAFSTSLLQELSQCDLPSFLLQAVLQAWKDNHFILETKGNETSQEAFSFFLPYDKENPKRRGRNRLARHIDDFYDTILEKKQVQHIPLLQQTENFGGDNSDKFAGTLLNDITSLKDQLLESDIIREIGDVENDNVNQIQNSIMQDQQGMIFSFSNAAAYVSLGADTTAGESEKKLEAEITLKRQTSSGIDATPNEMIIPQGQNNSEGTSSGAGLSPSFEKQPFHTPLLNFSLGPDPISMNENLAEKEESSLLVNDNVTSNNDHNLLGDTKRTLGNILRTIFSSKSDSKKFPQLGEEPKAPTKLEVPANTLRSQVEDEEEKKKEERKIADAIALENEILSAMEEGEEIKTQPLQFLESQLNRYQAKVRLLYESISLLLTQWFGSSDSRRRPTLQFILSQKKKLQGSLAITFQCLLADDKYDAIGILTDIISDISPDYLVRRRQVEDLLKKEANVNEYKYQDTIEGNEFISSLHSLTRQFLTALREINELMFQKQATARSSLKDNVRENEKRKKSKASGIVTRLLLDNENERKAENAMLEEMRSFNGNIPLVVSHPYFSPNASPQNYESNKSHRKDWISVADEDMILKKMKALSSGWNKNEANNPLMEDNANFILRPSPVEDLIVSESGANNSNKEVKEAKLRRKMTEKSKEPSSPVSRRSRLQKGNASQDSIILPWKELSPPVKKSSSLQPLIASLAVHPFETENYQGLRKAKIARPQEEDNIKAVWQGANYHKMRREYNAMDRMSSRRRLGKRRQHSVSSYHLNDFESSSSDSLIQNGSEKEILRSNSIALRESSVSSQSSSSSFPLSITHNEESMSFELDPSSVSLVPQRPKITSLDEFMGVSPSWAMYVTSKKLVELNNTLHPGIPVHSSERKSVNKIAKVTLGPALLKSLALGDEQLIQEDEMTDNDIMKGKQVIRTIVLPSTSYKHMVAAQSAHVRNEKLRRIESNGNQSVQKQALGRKQLKVLKRYLNGSEFGSRHILTITNSPINHHRSVSLHSGNDETDVEMVRQQWNGKELKRIPRSISLPHKSSEILILKDLLSNYRGLRHRPLHKIVKRDRKNAEGDIHLTLHGKRIFSENNEHKQLSTEFKGDMGAVEDHPHLNHSPSSLRRMLPLGPIILEPMKAGDTSQELIHSPESLGENKTDNPLYYGPQEVVLKDPLHYTSLSPAEALLLNFQVIGLHERSDSHVGKEKNAKEEQVRQIIQKNGVVKEMNSSDPKTLSIDLTVPGYGYTTKGPRRGLSSLAAKSRKERRKKRHTHKSLQKSWDRLPLLFPIRRQAGETKLLPLYGDSIPKWLFIEEEKFSLPKRQNPLLVSFDESPPCQNAIPSYSPSKPSFLNDIFYSQATLQPSNNNNSKIVSRRFLRKGQFVSSAEEERITVQATSSDLLIPKQIIGSSPKELKNPKGTGAISLADIILGEERNN